MCSPDGKIKKEFEYYLKSHGDWTWKLKAIKRRLILQWFTLRYYERLERNELNYYVSLEHRWEIQNELGKNRVYIELKYTNIDITKYRSGQKQLHREYWIQPIDERKKNNNNNSNMTWMFSYTVMYLWWT